MLFKGIYVFINVSQTFYRFLIELFLGNVPDLRQI